MSKLRVNVKLLDGEKVIHGYLEMKEIDGKMTAIFTSDEGKVLKNTDDKHEFELIAAR